MYCPLCGNKMEEASKSCDHIDCEWIGAEGDWADDIYDESIHWICSNKCFPKDNPLIQHAAPSGTTMDDINQHFAEVSGGSISDIKWLQPNKSWSLTCNGEG